MNLINPENLKYFDVIRANASLKKEQIPNLFRSPVNDQIPLQHRVSEFDFLSSLSREDQDMEIMRYAVHCLIDVLGCGLELKLPGPYVACLAFAREDVDPIWPELFFANSQLEGLALMSFGPPVTDFAVYIERLVCNLSPDYHMVVMEHKGKESDYDRVFVEMRIRSGELNRTALLRPEQMNRTSQP